MHDHIERHEETAASPIIRLVFGAIQLWLVVMALILVAAFLLGILGANPTAPFAAWIYNRTDDIMRPFNGLFDPIELTDGTVVRTSLLFAIVVYAVLAALAGGISRRITRY